MQILRRGQRRDSGTSPKKRLMGQMEREGQKYRKGLMNLRERLEKPLDKDH